MSIYIAKDRAQTGPFDNEQVTRGLRDGTFAPTDLAWREGLKDWVPLSQLVASPAPPPLPSTDRKVCGLAIASLATGLGVFLFGPFSGVAAVITGHAARSKIKASYGRLTGAGMALAGMILGYMSFVILPFALMAAIAVPSFLRARKRSQATTVLNDLRLIDSATDQYAIESNRTRGFQPTPEDIRAYLRPGTRLHDSFVDILGNEYVLPPVESLPSVPRATYEVLSDVAPGEFWSPYPVGN